MILLLTLISVLLTTVKSSCSSPTTSMTDSPFNLDFTNAITYHASAGITWTNAQT